MAIAIIVVIIIVTVLLIVFNRSSKTLEVNLTDLTYAKKNESESIKRYTENEYDDFINDYNNGELPDIYITEFLFDGVSTYKAYDLDDFIESGNDLEVETFTTTAININTTGNIELTGEITGGMIAINTNDVTKDINLILNNVKIDTDSKKIPAIYVYNKDINYTDSKVTIKLKDNTKNYIEGGKFKKVSLVASEELENYTNKYTGTNKTNYEKYSNYYGIYSSSELDNILFAKVEANEEKLRDGDPYYYYKGAGAISSDIDLYFEGSGYLEVTSKKKEGIETKGNLTLGNGTGDYVVYALDDCLNTTTTATSSNSNVRNTLTIDVNTLTAIVLEDADEGDAIDSNGKMVINGGTIIALSHPGADSGLDAEDETYINGGTIIATGDMYDEVLSDSKQNFMLLSFSSSVQVGDLITLLDENDNVIFAHKTDRVYRYLVYSSQNLKNGTYTLYKNGTIEGTENNGFYTKINSYEKGTQLAYSSKGNVGGMGGGMQPNRNDSDENIPNNSENMTPPDGEKSNMDSNDDNRPTPPSENDGTTPPDKPDGNDNMNPPSMDNNNMFDMGENTNQTASNKDFAIDSISNLFNGISTYSE